MLHRREGESGLQAVVSTVLFVKVLCQPMYRQIGGLDALHTLLSKNWPCSRAVFAYMSEQLLDLGLLNAVFLLPLKLF